MMRAPEAEGLLDDLAKVNKLLGKQLAGANVFVTRLIRTDVATLCRISHAGAVPFQKLIGDRIGDQALSCHRIGRMHHIDKANSIEKKYRYESHSNSLRFDGGFALPRKPNSSHRRTAERTEKGS
jgi:hypothetical protein